MLQKIRILFADDNEDLCGIIRDYLDGNLEFELLGTVRNGIDAFEIISQSHCDVAVIDLVMPHMDGLTLLQKVQESDIAQKPLFVVLSAMSLEHITRQAVDFGAAYFILKPFDFTVLIERIKRLYWLLQRQNELGDQGGSIKRVSLERDLDEEVVYILKEVGIPAHVQGYQFLKEAILEVVAQVDLLKHVTMQLYPLIARKFNTTPTRVERSIRNAIDIAWSRGQMESMDTLFGYSSYVRRGKPTNSEFIATVADRIRIG